MRKVPFIDKMLFLALLLGPVRLISVDRPEHTYVAPGHVEYHGPPFRLHCQKDETPESLAECPDPEAIYLLDRLGKFDSYEESKR